MRKIIQLCSFESVYNTNLQLQLSKNSRYNENNTSVVLYFDHLLDEFHNKCKKKDYSNYNVIQKIFFWILFNRYLNKTYHNDKKKDIVHIQFVDFRYIYILFYLKNNFKKIIITFWGSDLLRQKVKRLRLLRVLFFFSDIITFETEDMIRIFEKTIGRCFSKKYKMVRFGLIELDELDVISDSEVFEFCNTKKIDQERCVIVIGYNRIWEQQHMPVIESIKNQKIPKEQIFIVIPWTYGQDDIEYKKRIISTLDGDYDYCFLNERMNNREIACLRKATDIFVQVQTTDSLSATMLETLYAKKRVITGGWLPYQELYNLGIKMYKVDNPNEVGMTIKELLRNPIDISVLENNYNIIKEYSSWEKNIGKWVDLYN